MKVHCPVGIHVRAGRAIKRHLSRESSVRHRFIFSADFSMKRYDPMFSSRHTKLFHVAWIATSLLFFAGLGGSAYVRGDQQDSVTTDITVVVKEADSGQPIGQARITLQFAKPGSHASYIYGKPKQLVYGAKTDAQGRCKLVGITKGTIVLTITANGHQSYGRELQLEKDNQVFEIKLKKPQPLI
jgi:hypothetical protein